MLIRGTCRGYSLVILPIVTSTGAAQQSDQTTRRLRGTSLVETLYVANECEQESEHCQDLCSLGLLFQSARGLPQQLLLPQIRMRHQAPICYFLVPWDFNWPFRNPVFSFLSFTITMEGVASYDREHNKKIPR
jgi:hypothetical protein